LLPQLKIQRVIYSPPGQVGLEFDHAAIGLQFPYGLEDSMVNHQYFRNCLQLSPQWCVVVQMKNTPKSRHPVSDDSVERLSISISSEDKAALEKLAEDKKVSLAWVIREAVSLYLTEKGARPKE
jgi:ribbon-helix-helix CopG family protein